MKFKIRIRLYQLYTKQDINSNLHQWREYSQFSTTHNDAFNDVKGNISFLVSEFLIKYLEAKWFKQFQYKDYLFQLVKLLWQMLNYDFWQKHRDLLLTCLINQNLYKDRNIWLSPSRYTKWMIIFLFIWFQCI